jgi:hypothetical protein
MIEGREMASDVVAYSGAFVVGEVSEIVLNDPDEDGDLDKYTNIIVTYTSADGKKTKQWTVKAPIPILTKWKDEHGTEHQAVNSVIVPVIPELPPPGCLGLFIPAFPRRPKGKGKGFDPPTTGTLTGSLTPPGGTVVKGKGHGQKNFTVKSPAIYYGTRA